MPIYKNHKGILNTNLNGEYLDITEMSPISAQFVKNFNGLVVVREYYESSNSLGATNGYMAGTLWYKGNVLAFTVEDPPAQSKVWKSKKGGFTSNIKDARILPNGWERDTAGVIAIPGNLSTLYQHPPKQKSYKLRAISASPNFVKYSKGSNGKILQVVGVNDKSIPEDLRFTGILIHGGSNAGWSHGCLIISDTRYSPNKIRLAYDFIPKLTNFVIQNNIKKITYIDDFSAPKISTRYNIKGGVKLAPPLPPEPKIIQINGVSVEIPINPPLSSLSDKFQRTYDQFIKEKTLTNTKVTLETFNPPPIESKLYPIYADPSTNKTYNTSSFCNKNGEYELSLPHMNFFFQDYPDTTSLEAIGENGEPSLIQIKILTDGYDAVRSIPLNGDGTWKSNIGIKTLNPIPYLDPLPLSVPPEPEIVAFETGDTEDDGKKTRKLKKLAEAMDRFMKTLRDSAVVAFWGEIPTPSIEDVKNFAEEIKEEAIEEAKKKAQEEAQSQAEKKAKEESEESEEVGDVGDPLPTDT